MSYLKVAGSVAILLAPLEAGRRQAIGGQRARAWRERTSIVSCCVLIHIRVTGLLRNQLRDDDRSIAVPRTIVGQQTSLLNHIITISTIVTTTMPQTTNVTNNKFLRR
jgi:hypothetical protein